MKQGEESTIDLLTRIRFEDERFIFLESVFFIFMAWTLIAHIFDIVDVISTPVLIGAAMYDIVSSPEFATHMVPTIKRTAYGLAATIIIGTPLGIAMGMQNRIKIMFQDYIVIGLAMPGLFLALFAGMWFGISDVTPTIAASVISFPFLTQQVIEGIDDIDNELLEMAGAFSTSRLRVVRRVLIPSIMPEWFSGIRYALAIVWKTVTLAELVAAEDGFGFIVRQYLERLALDYTMAWTILFVFVILIVEYGLFRQLEKRVFSWRQDISRVMAV